MSYDLHGAWEDFAAHSSPLRSSNPRDDLTVVCMTMYICGKTSLFSIDWTINLLSVELHVHKELVLLTERLLIIDNVMSLPDHYPYLFHKTKT